MRIACSRREETQNLYQPHVSFEGFSLSTGSPCLQSTFLSMLQVLVQPRFPSCRALYEVNAFAHHLSVVGPPEQLGMRLWPKGYDIAKYSAFPHEKEILIEPGRAFWTLENDHVDGIRNDSWFHPLLRLLLELSRHESSCHSPASGSSLVVLAA